MFSLFKKHFIPHKSNDHRPHILRNFSVRIFITLILFFELVLFLLPVLIRTNFLDGVAAVLPAVLSNLTNEERQNQKLSTLAVNPLLNKAAEMKAQDMALKGYFAHTSPEGKTPWYWIEKVGYKYQYAGENLAIDFSDSKDVAHAWMDSPTHRANIVKNNYTEVGTGVASGMYEGHNTVFVAQVYANPLIEKISEVQFKKNTDKNPVSSIRQDLVENKVLGAEIAVNTGMKNPTSIQKLMASPRNTTNIFLFIIFGIISFALLLYVVIKMRGHHMDLITNGLIILALIGAITLVNYYWSHGNMSVTQSLDYSS